MVDGGSQLNAHWGNFRDFFRNNFDTSSLFQFNSDFNSDSAADAVSDIVETTGDGIEQVVDSDSVSDSVGGDALSDSVERVSDVVTDIAPEFDDRPAPDFSVPSLEIDF